MGGSCFILALLFFFGPFIWRFFLSLLGPLMGVPPGGQAWQAHFTASREQALRAYLTVLMPLLAKMAKSDGRVNEDEISTVERVLRQLNLSDEMRRYAQRRFVMAKDASVTFEDYAFQFASAVHTFEMRLATFQFLVEVAYADNRVTEPERQLLLAAARIFNLPAPLVQQIFAQMGVGGGRQYSGRSSAQSTHSRTSDLQLLGLGSTATADDIKRAYRKKVKELHPDRLQAQGLPESMLKQATERMAAINAAYERLKRSASY